MNISLKSSGLKALFLLFFWAISPAAYAQDQSEALSQAVGQLNHKAVAKYQETGIVLEMVNFHSHKMDLLAKKLEAGLYLALEDAFPNAKLILLSEVTGGVNLQKTTLIKGTYEQQGSQVVLRLRATRGMGGALLGQAEVRFAHRKKRRRTLVAVLDIESQSLNSTQRKIFSDIFRSALKRTGKFDLASSADVSKMDPDAIQKAYKCTRDECGTIIGKELGVDRVVSVSYGKIATQMYFLTAKVINIEQGSMSATESLQHDGNLRSFKALLDKMALKIAGQEGSPPPAETEKTAQLIIRSKPSGAGVSVDGKQRFNDNGAQLFTPAALQLTPGQYQVELHLQGYDKASFEVQMEGQDKRLFQGLVKSSRSHMRMGMVVSKPQPTGAKKITFFGGGDLALDLSTFSSTIGSQQEISLDGNLAGVSWTFDSNSYLNQFVWKNLFSGMSWTQGKLNMSVSTGSATFSDAKSSSVLSSDFVYLDQGQVVRLTGANVFRMSFLWTTNVTPGWYWGLGYMNTRLDFLEGSGGNQTVFKTAVFDTGLLAGGYEFFGQHSYYLQTGVQIPLATSKVINLGAGLLIRNGWRF